jgi:uncharacterized membrane protein YesL
MMTNQILIMIIINFDYYQNYFFNFLPSKIHYNRKVKEKFPTSFTHTHTHTHTLFLILFLVFFFYIYISWFLSNLELKFTLLRDN